MDIPGRPLPHHNNQGITLYIRRKSYAQRVCVHGAEALALPATGARHPVLPGVCGCRNRSMDIHAERLAEIKKAVQRTMPATIRPPRHHGPRRGAQGADGVITTILHGEVDVWHDILIPKYGVDTNVGVRAAPAAFSASCAPSTPSWTSPRISTATPDAVYLSTPTHGHAVPHGAGRVPKMKATGLLQRAGGTHAGGGSARRMTKSAIPAGINHQRLYRVFVTARTPIHDPQGHHRAGRTTRKSCATRCTWRWATM